MVVKGSKKVNSKCFETLPSWWSHQAVVFSTNTTTFAAGVSLFPKKKKHPKTAMTFHLWQDTTRPVRFQEKDRRKKGSTTHYNANGQLIQAVTFIPKHWRSPTTFEGHQELPGDLCFWNWSSKTFHPFMQHATLWWNPLKKQWLQHQLPTDMMRFHHFSHLQNPWHSMNPDCFIKILLVLL